MNYNRARDLYKMANIFSWEKDPKSDPDFVDGSRKIDLAQELQDKHLHYFDAATAERIKAKGEKYIRDNKLNEKETRSMGRFIDRVHKQLGHDDFNYSFTSKKKKIDLGNGQTLEAPMKLPEGERKYINKVLDKELKKSLEDAKKNAKKRIVKLKNGFELETSEHPTKQTKFSDSRNGIIFERDIEKEYHKHMSDKVDKHIDNILKNKKVEHMNVDFDIEPHINDIQAETKRLYEGETPRNLRNQLRLLGLAGAGAGLLYGGAKLLERRRNRKDKNEKRN